MITIINTRHSQNRLVFIMLSLTHGQTAFILKQVPGYYCLIKHEVCLLVICVMSGVWWHEQNWWLAASDKPSYVALYPSLSILILMGALVWLVIKSRKLYIRVSTIGLYTENRPNLTQPLEAKLTFHTIMIEVNFFCENIFFPALHWNMFASYCKIILVVHDLPYRSMLFNLDDLANKNKVSINVNTWRPF